MPEVMLYEVRDTSDDGIGFQPDDPWDHASEVRARDPEEAAEKYAESYDQDDYYLSKSERNEIVVEVRLAVRLTPVDATIHRFTCGAEHHTTYWADPVKAGVAAGAESERHG